MTAVEHVAKLSAAAILQAREATFLDSFQHLQINLLDLKLEIIPSIYASKYVFDVRFTIFTSSWNGY